MPSSSSAAPAVNTAGGTSAVTRASVPAADAAPLRTAIATVCISGTLEDKLTAAAAAGFDGVEIFEPDFVVSPMSAAEVRMRCADLGLSIDLYQPFRDLDSVRPEGFAANLRRIERKFDVMEQLGTDQVLVCSANYPDASNDDEQIAEQLHSAAVKAHERGLLMSYEALAWGTFVNTYERSWDIVRTADHPALGLCIDSFHILSRGSDPSGIEKIPGEKLFFLQLADAPYMDMDLLQWSRHHRLFPGQGTFDLTAFLGHVLAAGYRGPLSLEVFNDVFRQADPNQAALDAHRSLLALYESTVGSLPTRVDLDHDAAPTRVPEAAPTLPALSGFAFTELAVDEKSGPAVRDTLAALGFTHRGQHKSKPVELWQQGRARVLLNAAIGLDEHPTGAAVAAVAVETANPADAAVHAQALLAPILPRRRGPAEADLSAVAAPDGTSVFFCRTGATDDDSWLGDFTTINQAAAESGGITHTDHVALTQPYDRFEEAALFYRTVLGLQPQHNSEIAAPFGLVRNRAVANPDGSVRVCLSVSVLRRGSEWHPGVTDPQHVAFATDDIFAVARAAKAAGAGIVEVPANYYDDLDARLAPPSSQLSAMRELNVLLDRNNDGDFLHFYTAVLGGRVFFEVVQRINGYQGYGEVNSPVRMAAHRRQRTASAARSA
jgi:4-hydroxyphenylpyruvate dioxygenase